jgi:hypothetical protein
VPLLFAAANIRHRNNHLSVKATGSQQCRIQNIGAVGGRNQNDPFIGFKPIHLNQKLVQGLFSFVMPATESGTSMPANGIDLVNENDTGCILFALDEQIPYPGCAHAYEHFHKIRAADAKKGHSGFTRNGPRQKGFTAARRANQQDALGNAATQSGKFFGVSEKLDNFNQFFFGLIDPRNVFKGHSFRLIRHQTGATFTKRKGLAPAGLHLAHEKNPYADEYDHRKPGNQNRHIPRIFRRRFGADNNALLPKDLNQVRVLWSGSHRAPGPG